MPTKKPVPRPTFSNRAPYDPGAKKPALPRPTIDAGAEAGPFDPGARQPVIPMPRFPSGKPGPVSGPGNFNNTVQDFLASQAAANTVHAIKNRPKR